MVRISRVLIATAVAGLLVSGCSVSDTQRPALTGPSELALSLNLTANPDILTQDGSSQSRVVILARDASGAAVSGLSLHVGAAATIPACSAPAPPSWCTSALAIANGGQLSTTDVGTASDGRVTIVYTAPPLPPDNIDRGTTVTVTVIPVGSNYGNAVPRSVTLRLVPPGAVPDAPVASFTYSSSATVNVPVTFDGNGSSSGIGNIVAWSWDFGDNSTGTGASVQHTYHAIGSYTVTLVVIDELGRSSSPSTQTVTVSAAQLPTADFVFSPTTPAAGAYVYFNASASSAGAGRRLVDYAWDFGNGQGAHGVTASTQYAVAGAYNVTLVVTDDWGQTKSKTYPVTVH